MNSTRIRAEIGATLLWVWLPGLLLLGLALWVALASEITLRLLMQDATTVLGAPFYIGSLSMAGIIGWSLAVGVSIFTAIASTGHAPRPWRSFLLAMGGLTALLLVDDAYLLHDEIVPQYVGVRGELVGIAYVILTVFILYRFRNVVRQSNYILLGAALTLLGVSAAVDVGSSALSDVLAGNAIFLGEDGTKLIGTWTWLAYLASVSRQALRNPE